MAEAPSRQFLWKRRPSIYIPFIAGVSPICVASLQICLIGSLLFPLPVSPISATCSPGNNRFTARIRAERAVHASANCYWKKKGEKKKIAINRFRRLQIEMSCIPVLRRQATPSEPTLTWISVASSSFAIFLIFYLFFGGFLFIFFFFCKNVFERREFMR